MLRGIFGWAFDFPEFFFGLFLGVAAAYLALRLGPSLSWVREWTQKQARWVGDSLTSGATDRFRADLQTRAQTMHLARAVFALEEILVPPAIVAPSPFSDPLRADPVHEDIFGILPNIPDWTGLAGLYRLPRLPVEVALSSGANLLITGDLGSGKSTALASLALRSARRDPDAGVAAELTPILIHAANLRLDRRPAKDPLEPLVAAAQDSVSPVLASRLPAYLKLQFRQKHALLLLDGLDEFPQEALPAYAEWLERLQEEYPGTRIVATGPTMGYDGLIRAGLAPVTIAPWGEHEQRLFLSQWSSAWIEHVRPRLPKKGIGDVDPLLISGWLTGTLRGLTPLEVTSRVWSAFAGDIRGRSMADGLESYVARFLSPDERPSAEGAALAWLNERNGTVSERSLPRGTGVSDMVEAGILVRRAEGRVSFFHPLIGAYLAARAMTQTGLAEAVLGEGWAAADSTVGLFSVWGDISPMVERHLEQRGDPTEGGLFTCAHWIRHSQRNAPWRPRILRSLGMILADSERPYGLRLRCAEALVAAGETSVGVLFHRLLASDAPSGRVLGAMGLGALRDPEAVPKLVSMVNQDPHFRPRQAACLALSAIGSDPAMEALGHALLSGEEAVRLAAAEALAIHPDEGYNMLRDAVELDDLLTRRAAVFGLARLPEPWVLGILEKVQVDDKQWVVRGAAAEASERRRTPPWKVPPIARELAELPWLVAFATREGLGLAPGRAALEIVRRALSNGTAEEKLAALAVMAHIDTADLSIDIYAALRSPDPGLRDAAFEALWRQAAAGVPLPAPV